MAYDDATAKEFNVLAEEIGSFHDEVEAAAKDKNLGDNAIFLDDNSPSFQRMVALSSSADVLYQKISDLEQHLIFASIMSGSQRPVGADFYHSVRDRPPQ